MRNVELKTARHARRVLDLVTRELDADQDAKAAALAALTADTLQEFARTVMRAAHVEGLLVGNLTATEAMDIGDAVRAKLPGVAVAPDAWPRKRVAALPIGSRLVSVNAVNAEEANNVTHFYFQIGPSTLETRAMVRYKSHLSRASFFSSLRDTTMVVRTPPPKKGSLTHAIRLMCVCRAGVRGGGFDERKNLDPGTSRFFVW